MCPLNIKEKKMNKELRVFLVSNAKSKSSDGENWVHYTEKKKLIVL